MAESCVFDPDMYNRHDHDQNHDQDQDQGPLSPSMLHGTAVLHGRTKTLPFPPPDSAESAPYLFSLLGLLFASAPEIVEPGSLL